MRISAPVKKSKPWRELVSKPKRKPDLHEVKANKDGTYARTRHKARIHLPVLDGCVFVASDEHYQPGKETLAYRAFIHLAKEMKPWAVISNGDAFDGSKVSRFDASSFGNLGNRHDVATELAAVRSRLDGIRQLDVGTKFFIWNMGNHDARFETYLATRVPEYMGVEGFTLKEHFPDWLPAWQTFIGDQVIIAHRFKGGMYAANNNALWAGRTFVSGHLHGLYAKALTDYNGTRWGIEAGTLADTDAACFVDYLEGREANWQSGFAILHFRDGVFTGPELVHALPDGRVLYQGKVLKV